MAMIPTELQEVICVIKSVYGLNQNLPQPYHTIFSTLYYAICIFAFVCNSLLLVSLYCHNKNRHVIQRLQSTTSVIQHHRIRKPHMSEKTRDHLIGVLASLDLILTLTMPFTALDVLTKYWPLGPNTEFIIRLTRAVPSSLISTSSMVITLIAINCYRQILHSSERQMTPHSIGYVLILISVISAIVSTPIFYFTKLNPVYVNELKDAGIDINKNNISTDLELNTITPDTSYNESIAGAITNISENQTTTCEEYNELNIADISFVEDDWTFADQWVPNSRFWYSLFSIVTQLIIPFFIISFCYYSVSRRLQKQTRIQRRVVKTTIRIKKENERNKRRNKLLATISLVYLMTWLPLGLFGTLSDSNNKFFGEDPKTTSIVFMVCHMLGMSSSCANPIIYGFRNKHIRQGKT